MRIITEADRKISKIWGDGKIQPGTYRKALYTVSSENEDGELILNTLTGELIFLERDEAEKLWRPEAEYSPQMDDLIKKHFLVRKEHDDKKTADSLRAVLKRLNTANSINSFTVIPTTACNARCFYCFESEITQENMSDATADRLVCFMDSQRRGEPLHISWFGGEPLMGKRQIDRICSLLNERNIEFSSSMMSNGYLFDDKTVRRAKDEWHLKDIQITLDGTEKIYNETKAYANPCMSPFRKVMSNISLLLHSGIEVSIRLNLGIHNADDLSGLIDELAEHFAGETNINVYTNILFDGCGFEPVHFDEEQTEMLREKKRMLDEKLCKYSRGKNKEKLPKLITHRCMADSPSSLVVTPKGMLGKCENYLDTHFAGSLETGITDIGEAECFCSQLHFSICDTCPMYPACIKLNCCKTDRFCNESSKRDVMENTILIMRHYYLQSQKNTGANEARDEKDNC